MEERKNIITYEYIEYDDDGKEMARWLELGPEPDCKICRGKMWLKKYDGGTLEIFPRRKRKSTNLLKERGCSKRSKKDLEVIQTFTYVMCECNPCNSSKKEESEVKKKDLHAIYQDIQKEATSLASSDRILTRNQKKKKW